MSEKPQFDPSKPFDVPTAAANTGAKPQFDPTRPFDVPKADPTGKVINDVVKIASLAPKAMEVIGNAYDTLSGSKSTRQFLYDQEKGKTNTEALGNAVNAYRMAAPGVSGKEIAQLQMKNAGEKDTSVADLLPGLVPRGSTFDVSKSGVKGIGIDLAADPTLFAGTAAKGLGLIGKYAGKVAMVPARAMFPGTAAVAEGAAKGAADALKYYGGALNSTIRGGFAADVQTAKKFGVDPELLSPSLKYGEGSSLARAKRARAQMPGGDADIAKHQMGANQIRQAADDYITTNIGEPLHPIEAGQAIREAWNHVTDKFFKERNVTYKTVVDQVPGPLSDQTVQHLYGQLEDVHNQAQRLIEQGTKNQKVQGTYIQEALSRLDGALQSHPSLDTLVLQMQDIGDAAFKDSKAGLSDIPHNKKLSQELYFALRDSVYNAVEQSGRSDLVSTLKQNNADFSNFLTKQKHISSVILDDTKGGETVFRELVQSADSKKLQNLSEILSQDPVTMGKVKASFLEDLKSEDKIGGFSFARLGSALRNNPKTEAALKTLFSPDEIKNIGEIVNLGERHGDLFMNTSRTAETSAFSTLGQAFRNTVANQSYIGAMERKAERNAGKGIFSDTKSGFPGIVQGFQQGLNDTTGSAAQSFGKYIINSRPSANLATRKATQLTGITNKDKGK